MIALVIIIRMRFLLFVGGEPVGWSRLPWGIYHEVIFNHKVIFNREVVKHVTLFRRSPKPLVNEGIFKSCFPFLRANCFIR